MKLSSAMMSASWYGEMNGPTNATTIQNDTIVIAIFPTTLNFSRRFGGASGNSSYIDDAALGPSYDEL